MAKEYDDLMLSMFEVLLKDYLMPPKKCVREWQSGKKRVTCYESDRGLEAEAKRWIFFDDPNDTGYALSFRMVCYYFGWDIDYMRRGIAKAKARAKQGVKIEFNRITSASSYESYR